jgi:hypothetical protein
MNIDGTPPIQQSPQRNYFGIRFATSLTRLFFRPSAEGDAYIAHGLEARVTKSRIRQRRVLHPAPNILSKPPSSTPV